MKLGKRRTVSPTISNLAIKASWRAEGWRGDYELTIIVKYDNIGFVHGRRTKNPAHFVDQFCPKRLPEIS